MDTRSKDNTSPFLQILRTLTLIRDSEEFQSVPSECLTQLFSIQNIFILASNLLIIQVIAEICVRVRRIIRKVDFVVIEIEFKIKRHFVKKRNFS